MVEPRKGAGPRGRAVGRGQRDPLKIDASSTGWMRDGKCAKTPGCAEEWFPGAGAGGGPYARKQCAGCPVIDTCLQYALTNNIEYGIYGGKTAYQRARMLGKKYKEETP